MRTSESRKRAEEAEGSQPLFVLREADRLNRNERVLRALRSVYGDADVVEGDALALALEDEELLA